MKQTEILDLAMLGILKKKDNIAELVKLGNPEAKKEEEELDAQMRVLARLLVLEREKEDIQVGETAKALSGLPRCLKMRVRLLDSIFLKIFGII